MTTNTAVVAANTATHETDAYNSPTASSGLRTELIGHVSVLLLGLLGIAMYSATYSVSMAVRLSSKSVPLLEFWAVFSQMGCTVVCIGLQFVVGGLLRVESGLHSVAEAQVAVFLGIACSCTILSADCMAGETDRCSLFFPSAVYAPAAGMGLIVWSWTLYLASLGCLRSNIGTFSLGIQGIGGVVIAGTMMFLPSRAAAGVVSICGRQSLPAGLCSGLGDDCGSSLLSALTWLSVGIVVVAGSLRTWPRVAIVGICAQLVGSVLMVFTCVLLLDAGVASLAYRLTAMGFAMCTSLESIVALMSLALATRPSSTNIHSKKK